jgi:hypothetical protein
MPFHAGPQVEGDGQSVRADGPAFRKARNGLALAVIFDKALEDLGRNEGRCEAGIDGGEISLPLTIASNALDRPVISSVLMVKTSRKL